MRACYVGEHAPDQPAVMERKETTGKPRTAAAGGALATNH